MQTVFSNGYNNIEGTIDHRYFCAIMMASRLQIVLWNVRGLNNKFKRAKVFQNLRQVKPHIVLLQETHLEGSKMLSLRKPWIQRAFHSTY